MGAQRPAPPRPSTRFQVLPICESTRSTQAIYQFVVRFDGNVRRHRPRHLRAALEAERAGRRPLAAVAVARTGGGASRHRGAARRRLGRLPAAQRARRGLRPGVRQAPRLRPRPLRRERHRLARSSAPGDGRRARRRSDRARLHLRGDRLGGPVRRLRPRVRRHRPGDVLHRRERRGGPDHGADAGNRPGPPGDDRRRPGRDRSARRETRARGARGLRARPRRPLAGTRRRNSRTARTPTAPAGGDAASAPGATRGRSASRARS